MASAAVQSEWMAGLCLPMTTSCLPTALILHRGHWSGSYWFFLSFPLSFFRSFFLFLFLPLCIRLPLRSVCPGQEDQAGGDGQLPQQPTTWRAKRRKRWPQPRTGWVSSACPSAHTHMRACELFNCGGITRRTVVVCTHLRCQVNTTWAAVFMCGCWTKLIKTRMWHHLWCQYVSSERRWMKNKLQQQWVSTSNKIRNRHLVQVIQTIKPFVYIFLLPILSFFPIVFQALIDAFSLDFFAYLWDSIRFRKRIPWKTHSVICSVASKCCRQIISTY